MWRGQSRRWAVVLLTTATAVASEGRAQAKGVDPTAAEVAVALRDNGRYQGAVSALTQARGPRSQQELDEIADTLVAIAASFRSSDESRGVVTRTTALTSLVDAGLGRTDIVGVEKGVPYSGAATRLMRLAETAEDISIRGGALRGLVRLPNGKEYLPFLRRVVLSENPAAWQAAVVLVTRAGPEGRAIARELSAGGRVPQPRVREYLDNIAPAPSKRP